MPTGDLGYWYSIDTVDDAGRIVELGKVCRFEPSDKRGYTLAQAKTRIAEYAQPHQQLRVWPIEAAADLGVDGLRKPEWGPDRRFKELVAMIATGEFVPAPAWAFAYEQSAPHRKASFERELRAACGIKPDWGPDRRSRELAEMYARGEFNPTAEYLEAHPELVAAQVKAQAAQAPLLAVEEPVAVVKPAEQPKPAQEPIQRTRRATRQRKQQPTPVYSPWAYRGPVGVAARG